MAMLLIDGVGVKDPSEWQWSSNDISDPKSGRAMNGLMYKNRVAQKRKLHIAWWNPTPAEAMRILNALDPVYIFVTYPDAKTGRMETKEFYCGDPVVPMSRWASDYKRYSKISIDLIER